MRIRSQASVAILAAIGLLTSAAFAGDKKKPAKNDPEGTAGIINIVLNQEAEVGWSGGLNANTGTTGQAGFSGNVGRQAGPLHTLTPSRIAQL